MHTNNRPNASDPGERERLQRLRPALELRARMLAAIRAFLEGRHFLAVETPVRLPAPALEDYIEAEPSGNQWLRTSPELHMKRLLAAATNVSTRSAHASGRANAAAPICRSSPCSNGTACTPTTR
jgi:hypothetical protein